MKEIKIHVKGMVCRGCEKRVETAIKSLKEIKKVKADHTLGTVSILAKEEIEESMINEKIQDIGFEII